MPITYRRRDGGQLVRALPGVLRACRAGHPAPVEELHDGEGRQRTADPHRQRIRPDRPGVERREQRRERAERRVGPRCDEPARRRSARRGRARPKRRSVSAPSTAPVRGRCRSPSAQTAIDSGSAASRWRGGNQKPNIVGARNPATTSCAPSTVRQIAAARSSRLSCGTARARWSRLRPVEEPQPGEGEQEERRPAQQAVVAVDEQRDEPVRAVEVAAGEGRVGGASRRRCRRCRGSVRRRAPR